MARSKSITSDCGPRTSKRRSQHGRNGSAPAESAKARRTEPARATFEKLLAQGATLWGDDEFEQFRAWLCDTRRRGD